MLLLPGTHEGPLVLSAYQEVYVFGRGLATLRTAGTVVTSVAARGTKDRLIVVCEVGRDHNFVRHHAHLIL